MKVMAESPEPPPEADVEEAWAELAERRWREIEAGTVETIPWNDVRASLFRITSPRHRK